MSLKSTSVLSILLKGKKIHDNGQEKIKQVTKK